MCLFKLSSGIVLRLKTLKNAQRMSGEPKFDLCIRNSSHGRDILGKTLESRSREVWYRVGVRP